MPMVSVIMPTFNRADTIQRSIRSVQAQTFTDWELIVVDDGSTDNTVALIEGCDPRLKILRQENQGAVGARNAGLRASAGSYIAFLDSDDEWLPHHLELCVSFLSAFPEEQFVTNELWEDFGRGRVVNHYRVHVNLSREGIKQSPEYDSSKLISREYETQLYRHHGQTGYWLN
jgi:glycosyltransferase involved in cell wall biosynthesis